MCGLTGYLAAHAAAVPLDPALVLGRMADALRHRGPDDAGLWHDPAAGIGFGFRRLAIVDLSLRGHQPMHSAGRRYTLVFNGEIYNFPELRRQLADLGHRFQGGSDTEVLMAGIEQWGFVATIPRLAGMFAMAVWDRDQRILHFARDRLGKKPLYLARHRNLLIFGSELKALLAFPGFRPAVDRGVLGLYLRYGYVPDPYAIYEQTFKLPAASTLSVSAAEAGDCDAAQLLARCETYWSLLDVVREGQRVPLAISAEDAMVELDRELRAAVAQRLIADVPLGAFLSGGIDSSLVVALMQAQAGRPVRTFSIGFRDPSVDEAGHARAVARHLGTDHTELYVTPADALAVIADLPDLYDEPLADNSQIPTSLLCRLARHHVTVALSGDGGDESFGGYPRYRAGGWVSPVLKLPGCMRRLAGQALARATPEHWDRLLALARRIAPRARSRYLSGQRLHSLAAMITEPDPAAMYQRIVSFWPPSMQPALGARALPEALSTFDWRTRPAADFASSMMYLDTVTYLTGDILTKVDRASMAMGLETRCPLLDHRVVELAWRLPASMKLRAGKGKWLLRQLLGRYLPVALFERQKQGFGVPTAQWLRGPLRGWAGEQLEVERLRAQGYLCADAVERAWREHQSGAWDHSTRLWAVLMFQAWLERWQPHGSS